MKKIYSFIACCLISLVLFQQRAMYADSSPSNPFTVTDWDALGYYMYLPGLIIYNDVSQLNWIDSIDKKYHVTGGALYQAGKQENGRYVFKYLGGVSILQAPFFLAAHVIAKNSGYPADGFSAPYQWAIAIGAIISCILALFLLRKILLLYFDDKIVAVTLLLLCLATNLVQYVAVDGGMSHAWIFPLYAALLYTTICWHQKPKAIWAFLTGVIIGLATICRPTEAVMLFIPLCWGTHNKEAAKTKWQMVKAHRIHIAVAVLGGLLGILPQLLYWKSVTGSFVYDVGSKWSFLNPFFRVLFGWEKGWFIYTPVTVFFIAGMFFVKKYPFGKSVLWFCLLNIYIVISWFDWRYGGSYSARALVQSYPVFALPLAAFIQWIDQKKWRAIFYTLGLCLVAVNIFQVWQYNRGILHYNDMNRQYYGRIYLNRNPSPLDMSLMDTDDWFTHERQWHRTIATVSGKTFIVKPGEKEALLQASLPTVSQMLKIQGAIKVDNSLWDSYLCAEMRSNDTIKQTRIRLFNPLARENEFNKYAFYMERPAYFENGTIKIFVSASRNLHAEIRNLSIIAYEK